MATPKSPPFSGLDAASLDPSLSLSTPPIPSSVCIFLPFLCSPSFLALLLSPQSPLEGRTHCSTMATIAHSTSPLLNAVTPLLECGAQQEADHQMHFPQHQQQQQSRHERASRDPPQSHLHISSLKRGHRERGTEKGNVTPGSTLTAAAAAESPQDEQQTKKKKVWWQGLVDMVPG